MENVLRVLELFGPMPEDLKAHLSEIAVLKEYKKGHIFVAEDSISKYVYFIESGSVRCSFSKAGHIERISWFMIENDFFISVSSFLEQIPAEERIEALEKCVVYYISYAQFMATLERWLCFNRNFARILAKYYSQASKREQMRMKAPKERYRFLMEKQPELVKKIKDKYLCEYLDVSRNTFYKLKRNYRLSHRKE